MSFPPSPSRNIRAGSAALAAEQSKSSAVSTSGAASSLNVRAGISARDAEDRRRMGPSAPAGTAGFSLRGQGGRVSRQPGAQTRDALPEPIAQPVTGQPLGSREPKLSSPGLLQSAAAQLQSGIRAFFRRDASS